MVKKEYIQPQAKIHIVKYRAILAGSLGVGEGNTSQQNAKQFNFDIIDDEEGEE